MIIEHIYMNWGPTVLSVIGYLQLKQTVAKSLKVWNAAVTDPGAGGGDHYLSGAGVSSQNSI